MANWLQTCFLPWYRELVRLGGSITELLSRRNRQAPRGVIGLVPLAAALTGSTQDLDVRIVAEVFLRKEFRCLRARQ